MAKFDLPNGSLAIKIASEAYDAFSSEIKNPDDEKLLRDAVQDFGRHVANASAMDLVGDAEAAQEAREFASAAKSIIVGFSALKALHTTAKLKHVARKHLVPLAVRVLSML